MCLDRGLADDKLPVAHLRVRRSIPGEEFPPFCVERLMQRSIQAGISRYHPQSKGNLCQTISIPVMYRISL